jgi:hypothetical protein
VLNNPNLDTEFLLGAKRPKNGYKPFEEKMTVHVVLHSHDDVGWLKTKADYYSGDDPDHRSNASVKKILDSVIKGLIKNEDRTFSQVEMSFFLTVVG